MASKRAVVLAGGYGTRLRPYTTVLPKPLMPIGAYPILEVVVRQLAQAGFTHITMAVNHQAEIIKAYFKNGERWNTQIDYSLEKVPLGTMGPLKLIRDLPDDFLVMNGDVLTDLDFARFYAEHISRGDLFTISAFPREQKTDFGVLGVNDSGELISFKEKPISPLLVSMGVYMVSSRVLSWIPLNRVYGFDSLMADLLASHEVVRVCPFNGYWLDIGRPDDYERAIDEFDVIKNRFIND